MTTTYRDNPDAVRALDPAWAGAGAALADDVRAETAAPPSSLLDRLAADLAALQAYLPPGGGSNSRR